MSWSITIHKFEGLTISQSIVDLGPSETFAGVADVALSKVRRLSDLMLEPTSLERLQAFRKTVNFEHKSAEEKRFEGLDRLANQKYSKLF